MIPRFVAAIREGPEAGGVASTAATGTLARIIDWEQGDDGLLNLLCEGEQRIEVGPVEVERDKLLRAEVRRLPAEPPQALPRELAWTAELLAELLERMGEPFDRLSAAGKLSVRGKLKRLLR